MPIEYVNTTPIIYTQGLVSTTTNTAVQAVNALTTPGNFGGGFVWNPSGSPAGQISEDGFVNDIRSLPAGPSLVLRPEGMSSPSGVQVRRIAGGSNLSNVLAVCW